MIIRQDTFSCDSNPLHRVELRASQVHQHQALALTGASCLDRVETGCDVLQVPPETSARDLHVTFDPYYVKGVHFWL